MSRRFSRAFVSLMAFSMIATALVSAENTKAVDVIVDDPLIQTANELMHRGSSVAEFFETIFPDAWDNFSEEMQELMHRTPMQ